MCVYVRKTPESGCSVVLFTRQYRLLPNEYGLSMSLLFNWTLGYAHTHRVIVCICLQLSLMTTCRPASVLNIFPTNDIERVKGVYLQCSQTQRIAKKSVFNFSLNI